MKMFFQIAIALIAIVGLFFALGYLVKEQKNISEIVVKAPRELCWEVFQDESRMGEWMEGVVGVDMITKETAVTVGTKQKVRMSNAGGSSIGTSKSDLIRTITKVAQPKAFSYDYTNGIIDGSAAITFTASDSITTIKSVNLFRAKELWMRSTLFLIKSSINRNTQAQFDRLKVLIENDYQAQLNQQAEDQIETIDLGNKED